MLGWESSREVWLVSFKLGIREFHEKDFGGNTLHRRENGEFCFCYLKFNLDERVFGVMRSMRR